MKRIKRERKTKVIERRKNAKSTKKENKKQLKKKKNENQRTSGLSFVGDR